MKLLGTIQNCDIHEYEDGRVMFQADADIDVDGSDNRQHDPCWQADTSLRLHGRSIDAEAVPYIVVPPLIIQGVAGIVLGCRVVVTNMRNGLSCEAVVADIGPHKKIGEISAECARQIDVDDNPNTGGEDDPMIRYELFPGVPAILGGVVYQLQAS